MILEWFGALTEALGGEVHLAILAAALWGVLSILLSPCHLASIPLIIGYVHQRRALVRPQEALGLSAAFAVGILTTIVALGAVTAALGRLLGDIGGVGYWVVGVLLVVVGLSLMDLFPLGWSGNFLGRIRSVGVAGAFLIGLVFGVGLGPCTFAFMAPVLGVVFQVSAADPTLAVVLVLAFAAGHVGVIAVAGTLGSWVQRFLDWQGNARAVRVLRVACGALVVLGGLYLLTLGPA